MLGSPLQLDRYEVQEIALAIKGHFLALHIPSLVWNCVHGVQAIESITVIYNFW